MDAKIQQFITNLVDTFQLNESQLKEMWATTEAPIDTPMDTTEVKSVKKVPFTCNHIFTKKGGNVCSVKVATENGFCSKHLTVGKKKWEELVFAQIPETVVKYYKEKKNLMVAGEKLSRTTANNAAAWIMVLYKDGPTSDSTDFELDMQFAFMMSFIHPVFDRAQYFKNRPTAPEESNVDEYKKYECVRVEFEHAKKIYASQYPGNSSLKEFGI